MWKQGENVVVIIFMINVICTCNFISNNNIKSNTASEHQRTEQTYRTERPLIRQRGLLNRKPGKTSVYNLCIIVWLKVKLYNFSVLSQKYTVA